ncbi:MAG: helix-turn-helix domain-containing protein [Planctomycetota bacterium]|nr:helix-turn-helix domain-containing protein [Planctomycetota bacterium]MDE2215748.1 helix-turn-helix domain-containing protein [Planctomycetota bacterium]
MNKRYANIKEVSAYTSLPVKTLYEWASQGRIPSLKLGRRMLFDLEDVDRLLMSLKRNTSQSARTVNKILDDVRGGNYNALYSHTDTLVSHGKGGENV